MPKPLGKDVGQGQALGHEDPREGVDGHAAKEGIDAEPATGHHRPHKRRDVRAQNAKARAQEDRKRNAVLGARVRIEHQRNENDDVADGDGESRDAQGGAAGHDSTRQHIGGNAHRHAHPEGGDVPFRPRALSVRGRL